MPVIGDYLASNHVETGGLSGAVGAEEAHDLALVDFHRDSLYYGTQAVFLDQVVAMQFHRISSDKSLISSPTSAFLDIRSCAFSTGMYFLSS